MSRDRRSGIERESGGSGGLLGSIGGVLGVPSFLRGRIRVCCEPIRLTALLVGEHSSARRHVFEVGHIAFSPATRDDFEAGG